MLIAAAGVRSAHAETEGQETSAVKPVELLPSTSIADRTIDHTMWLSQTPIEQSAAADVQPRLDVHSSTPATRGAIFTTLEASHIALQGLDLAGTLWALDNGLVEANPVMRGLTAHPAALVAVKAAATGGTVLLARRLARQNRMAGIILMAAVDSAYTFVVVRNFALIQHARR